MLHELVEKWRNEIKANIDAKAKIPQASRNLFDTGKNAAKQKVLDAAKKWKASVFDAGLSHGPAAKELAEYLSIQKKPAKEPESEEKMSYKEILDDLWPSKTMSYKEAQKKASEIFQSQ